MGTPKISYFFPLAVVFFEMATYLANDMYLPGLPALMADLNITQREAQNTLLYWFLGTASMQLIIGPLSDTYGRKILLLIGALCFAITSFICALTDQISLFLIARFIQGCTVCAVVVAGYSAIHEFYDSKMAIKIIAIMSSIIILAPAFGPVLGAVIIETTNWRTIFYVLGVWGVVSLLFLFKAVPVTQTERFSIDLKVIGKDYIAIAFRKHFLAFTLPFCFLFLSLICWVVETPFLLIEHYQQSVLAYGLIQLYVFGCFMIGSQITGRLIHKYSPLYLIKWGLGIAFCGATVLMIFSLLHAPLFIIVICMMLIALGTAMAFGPLSRLAIESCQEPMGRRMAIFSSYMSFFGVIATLLISRINTDSAVGLASLITLGVIVSVILFLIIPKPKLELQDVDEITPPLI